MGKSIRDRITQIKKFRATRQQRALEERRDSGLVSASLTTSFTTFSSSMGPGAVPTAAAVGVTGGHREGEDLPEMEKHTRQHIPISNTQGLMGNMFARDFVSDLCYETMTVQIWMTSRLFILKCFCSCFHNNHYEHLFSLHFQKRRTSLQSVENRLQVHRANPFHQQETLESLL